MQEAPENIVQEKIMFNVVFILLGQYCTICNVVYEAPDNIAHEKSLSMSFEQNPFMATFIIDQLIF